jgi:hypothetical protein
MAWFASMLGILFQINTLLFLYHPVLWMSAPGGPRSGTTGQRSGPGWRDFFIVVGGCLFYIYLFLPVFLRLKGAM